jgi:uridine kinase
MSPRSTTIAALAQRIARIALPHPVRVAIDGRTASGKTTFANELAEAIADLARPVIRTSIDGFHNPKSVRYARGRMSWQGYYHDARDLNAIVNALLQPLGPGGTLRYTTQTFDLQSDQPITPKFQISTPQAILIVDGTFLQRPELNPHWDASIYIAVSDSEAERRGIERDTKTTTDNASIRQLYTERYSPAFSHYAQTCNPEENADAVFDNEEFSLPFVRVNQNGRLNRASHT